MHGTLHDGKDEDIHENGDFDHMLDDVMNDDRDHGRVGFHMRLGPGSGAKALMSSLNQEIHGPIISSPFTKSASTKENIGRRVLHYVPGSLFNDQNDVQRMIYKTSNLEDVCIHLLSENGFTVGKVNVALEMGLNSSVSSIRIRRTL